MNKEKKLVSFDWAIKYLFKGKEGHIAIEGFLNALLKFDNENFESIKIIAKLDNQSKSPTWEKRYPLANLLIEDSEGNKYIVELERAMDKAIMHKAILNVSRAIINSIPAGEILEYFEIKKMFHITLVYFELGESCLFHGETIIKDLKTRASFELEVKNPRDGKIVHAEKLFPEYFFISIPNFNNNIIDDIDEWLYIIKNEYGKDKFNSKGIREAIKLMNCFDLSKKDLIEWEIHRKNISDMYYKIESSFEKGIVQGIRQEKLKIAYKMKKKGYTAKEILEDTELSKADIEKLMIKE